MSVYLTISVQIESGILVSDHRSGLAAPEAQLIEYSHGQIPDPVFHFMVDQAPEIEVIQGGDPHFLELESDIWLQDANAADLSCGFARKRLCLGRA